MSKVFIIPDVHCRSFYKPVLDLKNVRVIFLGDYMDPYGWEGTTDEDGIANLEEIFDFAKKNPDRVTLLFGNHDASWMWSHLGFERTQFKWYRDLHTLYRDNVDLLHPVLKIDDILYTHAGVCRGWVEVTSEILNKEITEDNIVSFIEEEFAKELEHEAAIENGFYYKLNSRIFDIGRSRGGYAPYGGPFWSDFYEDFRSPVGWECFQIVGHQQGEFTGLPRQNRKGVCLDSRAIFEYDTETGLIVPSEINDEKTKKQILDFAWKGVTIGPNQELKDCEPGDIRVRHI